MNFIRTFTADRTTAELAWDSRGVTRSQILWGEREKNVSTRQRKKQILKSKNRLGSLILPELGLVKNKYILIFQTNAIYI